MIERLRTLPAPLRYLIYVVGLFLMFLVALGVGATVAVVAGRQFGQTETGPAETRTAGTTTLESTGLETTGPTSASEGTTIEPSGGSEKPRNTSNKTSFVHRATDENSRGDYTYISDPSIDGDANAIVLVSLASDRESSEVPSYEHNIGVWYESVRQEWAVFNQDLAAVPAGTTFEVVVPQASASFVHRADLLNTAGHYTYLDDRLTNGQPDAVLSVTQNWNPGGGRGIYNDHPVGTQYDAKLQKWAVYNQDGVSMPEGAAFNIAVSEGEPGK